MWRFELPLLISVVSDQSGRDEVYVRDLAGRGDQVLVSLEGGNEPVWSPDGVPHRGNRGDQSACQLRRLPRREDLRNGAAQLGGPHHPASW